MIIKCCLIILAQCCFHSLGEPGLYALWILCSRKENSRIEVCEFKKNLRGQFLSALYPGDVCLGWSYVERDSRKTNRLLSDSKLQWNVDSTASW